MGFLQVLGAPLSVHAHHCSFLHDNKKTLLVIFEHLKFLTTIRVPLKIFNRELILDVSLGITVPVRVCFYNNFKVARVSNLALTLLNGENKLAKLNPSVLVGLDDRSITV